MQKPRSAVAVTAITLAFAAGLGHPAPGRATPGQGTPLGARIDELARAVEPKVLAWRRDFHQHPELSNREQRTAAKVAEHLTALGLEVETGVAHHGVVGLLVGGKPGPVVALRADMDALPVSEEVDLPFASKVRATYNGQEVGVMHACGHDTHTAMLMGVAEVLAKLKPELPGTVKFIFQPAEEGAPEGEEGGAGLMIRQGVLEAPRPQAIFGLHVMPFAEAGEIAYRSGGTMASSDTLEIVVRGKQTHAAMPWLGVDPIVVASEIVLALQTIPSRQLNVTTAPAIVTIGSIHGGVRSNIIPDEVRLLGTLRALDTPMQDQIHERVRRTAEKIAEAAGATAEVKITRGNPVTYNDPALTRRMAPTLERVAGAERVFEAPPILGAEDFAQYQKVIPGLFFIVGIRPPGTPAAEAAGNHSPRFFVDESALPLGVRAMAHLAVDYLAGAPAAADQPR